LFLGSLVYNLNIAENMLNSKFWENYFKVYDSLNLLIPYQELLETICEELEIKKGEKILEAGCGTGNLALKIKERGAEVVGLDNCQEALDIYRKKDPTAKLVLADLRERLPFPDNYFDKIASNNTLYIIPKERQLDTLKELYRILKPRGKIVIANPKEDANVLSIYLLGIKQSIKKRGWKKTLKSVIKFLPQTLKMFYYNYLIKKRERSEVYNLLTGVKQKELLQKAGFVKISETKFIYANQGILNIGFKMINNDKKTDKI